MPGPGSRAKSKAKKSRPIASSSSSTAAALNDTVDAYAVEIDDDDSWNSVIARLCAIFELPDLTSRGGLKKVHANFDAIYQRLDTAYTRNLAHDRMRGGIVGIYTKMCVDSILRNKLFEKGFLDKLVPLLQIDSTRHLALRALVTMTQHGGAPVRVEIAKHANAIAKLIQTYPDDAKVAELGVTTLAHSVGTVVDGGQTPGNVKVMKTLDMTDILRTVVDAVRKPYPNPTSLIRHAIELVSISTMHASKSFLSHPPTTDFLVAGLRSKDWIARCECLSGLLRLHHLTAEDDQRRLDPNKFMASCERGVPDHLVDILTDYGQFRSEIFMTLKASSEFQRAMMTCAQDHNLYSLGLKLVTLILRTEFSIADGVYQVQDPVTGALTVESCGLPFRMWGDALPHCAKAIRQKGKKDEVDYADILTIKHHIMRARIQEAIKVAKEGIKRNPEQAYFYYAITLSADNVQGLRAAKKGLKCKSITPFIRFQMMQRAVEHAGDMGIKVLQREMPDAGDKRWEEAIAFLVSALEDAKTYVEEAPPDNRHMKNVGYWYILLTVLVREELTPDLSELKDSIRRLKIADQFSEFMGVPSPKTNMRLAQQTVIERYAIALRTFGIVYQRLDKANARSEGVPEMPAHEQLEDDLAAWLEDMTLENGQPEARSACGSTAPPKINFQHVTLYRCSWCGNPSAVLRKCSGCETTRYCDSDCQKSHWAEHKKNCKREN